MRQQLLCACAACRVLLGLIWAVHEKMASLAVAQAVTLRGRAPCAHKIRPSRGLAAPSLTTWYQPAQGSVQSLLRRHRDLRATTMPGALAMVAMWAKWLRLRRLSADPPLYLDEECLSRTAYVHTELADQQDPPLCTWGLDPLKALGCFGRTLRAAIQLKATQCRHSAMLAVVYSRERA